MTDAEIKLFLRKVRSLGPVGRMHWLGVFAGKSCWDYLRRQSRRWLVRTAHSSRPPLDRSDTVRMAIRTNWQEHGPAFLHIRQIPKQAATQLAQSAERVIQGHWELAGSQAEVGSRIDWHQHFDDEQDLHVLHRHRELLWVGKWLQIAPRSDRDWSYVRAVIADWISANPPSAGPGWHPYTLSERLVHWCWLLLWIPEDYLREDESWFQRTIGSLQQQAAFLSQRFEWHLGMHNHILNNARALLTVSACFPDLPNSRSWARAAVEAIRTVLPHQILPDGAHAEQSSTYHVLLTRTFWEYRELFASLDIEFPYRELLSDMIGYAESIVRSDGSLPFTGHITPDWDWRQLTGLMPLWRSGTPVQPSLLARLYGYVAEDESSGTEPRSDKARVFEASGTAVICRSGWHVVLSNDPRCRIMSHGDQNMLGLDVWWRGARIVADAGLDSYVIGERRAQLESWSGQSALILDDIPPLVSEWRRRQLPRGYFSAKGYVKTRDDASLEAGHSCYERLVAGAMVRRSVTVINEQELSIVDSLDSSGEHRYCANYLIPSTQPERLGSVLTFSGVTGGTRIRLTFPSGADINFSDAVMATSYGRLEHCTAVTSRQTMTDGSHAVRIGVER